MKIIVHIIVATTLAISCRQTNNQETASFTDSSSIDTTWTNFDAGKFVDDSDRPKEFGKFEITFEYEDKEQESKQKLGVTWVTNDSIEFRLFSEDGICDTNYWGNAQNNYPDMDEESDEDENGDSYSASEYVTEQDAFLLKIRISLDKDRARIIFVDKSGDETDCIPTPNLILTKGNRK